MSTCVVFFNVVVVYLFVVFRPTQECLHPYVDVTIAGEELQILTYAWHSWQLIGEGS